jgi:hypothetical protein
MNDRKVRIECLRLALSMAPSLSGEALFRLAEPMVAWVMQGREPRDATQARVSAPSPRSYGERVGVRGAAVSPPSGS